MSCIEVSREDSWCAGDVMVLPATQHPAVHHCDKDCKEGAAFYWVHDAPLLAYLGCALLRVCTLSCSCCIRCCWSRHRDCQI